MVTATFSIHTMEFFLMILARVSALIVSAPFFSITGVPNKVKVGLSAFLSIIIAMNVDYYDITYDGHRIICSTRNTKAWIRIVLL